MARIKLVLKERDIAEKKAQQEEAAANEPKEAVA
jgi:hypothetical protein